MLSTKTLLASTIGVILCANAQGSVLPNEQTNSHWFSADKNNLITKLKQTTAKKAKNVILFVGDGMGISTLTSARILQGQQQHMSGEEGYLSFEKFPYSAQVKTYNVDAQTPDSAGTMTAMISGIKTDAGVIGINEDGNRGTCQSGQGNELLTAIELAEIKGLSTGVISTARITHATPAATYAKSVERNWEDNSDMSETAIKAGCVDIATQLVNFESNLETRFSDIDIDGLDVVMGGGRRHFLPKDPAFNSIDAKSSVEGDRTDNVDLTAKWQELYPDGHYVIDQKGFDGLDASKVSKVFALFNESHMQYEADRKNDKAGEPSLSEMTTKAIDILDNNDKGFLLTIESGRIDHGHHAGSAYTALTDTIEFARAVQAAVDATDPNETLILVTADHSHVLTLAGYPKRGNPILGEVVAIGKNKPTLAADGQPYTTLSYANGKGEHVFSGETDADVVYDDDVPVSAGRSHALTASSEDRGYHQQATIPTSSESHAGEDVSLHARGPGAHLASGVIEQNSVFHIINQSLALTEK